MIIPRHLFEDYNGPNWQEAPANLQAVGTGAYRVAAFIEEDILIIGEDVVSTIKIDYEPNPHFREADRPFFRRVELRGGGDAKVAAEAVLKEGTIDYGYNLQVAIEALEDLEAHGKGILYAPPSAWTERVMINFADPNRETAGGERASTAFPHPFFADRMLASKFPCGQNGRVIIVPACRCRFSASALSWFSRLSLLSHPTCSVHGSTSSRPGSVQLKTSRQYQSLA